MRDPFEEIDVLVGGRAAGGEVKLLGTGKDGASGWLLTIRLLLVPGMGRAVSHPPARLVSMLSASRRWSLADADRPPVADPRLRVTERREGLVVENRFVVCGGVRAGRRQRPGIPSRLMIVISSISDEAVRTPHMSEVLPECGIALRVSGG